MFCNISYVCLFFSFLFYLVNQVSRENFSRKENKIIMQFVFVHGSLNISDLNARKRRRKEQDQFVGAIVADGH